MGVLLDGSHCPFVGMYNGRSSTVMLIFNFIRVVFHMLIRLQSHDNKLNRFVSVFTQCCDCMQLPRERLISSSDFIQSKRHKESTLRDFLTRKYWINLSENWFVSCLDTCLDTYEISKDFDYYCCDIGQIDRFFRIELIPSFVLSSDNTNCKNDIQLFHQLFDELSVYRDYH